MLTKYKIKDISLKITKGTTPITLGYPFVDNGINFIKAESITKDGRINESTFNFIDKKTNDILKRSQLQKDDIVISIAGVYLGKAAMITEKHLPANTNQAVGIIRIDKNKANPLYIHYILLTPRINKLLNSLCPQAAQPNINLAELGLFQIELPSLPLQTKIASILSTYDNLIENNNRRIKILEQMEQMIYQEWFVSFHFPGQGKTKMVKSELGSIPEGWKSIDVYSIIEEKDKRNKDNKKLDVLSVTNNHEFVKSEDYFSKRVFSRSLKNYKIVEFGNIAFNPARINIGSIAILNNFEIGLVSPMYSVFEAKIEIVTSYILWKIINQKTVFSQIVQLCFGGVRQVFKIKDFSLIRITLAPLSLQRQYEEIIAPIKKEIKILSDKNLILQQTRDLLLPRLVSGEIDVENLNIKKAI